MSGSKILITAPGLDTKHNVSGVSSVTNFIIGNNSSYTYQHFELGRKDDEKRNLTWFFKMIATSFKWMFTVASKNIKLVHFNFALSKPSIIRDAPLVLFAKLISKKIVIHLHGGDYLTKEVIPGWMKFTLKRVFSGNTPVIVLSPVEQEIIARRYHTKNIQVLPNCVDVKDAKAFVRNYDAEAELRLLFIGRISTSKGIAFIYDALVMLKNKSVPFKFAMAGAGPDEKEYVEKFSALLGNDFEFKGVVSGQAKTDLYKSSAVFLLPSLFEGLPMSLLEAMSFGLVPVVTGVGSMKYVVTTGENGCIVDKEPAAETAAVIEQLSADKNILQKMSTNAAAYIFKNFSPEDYIARLNKIYEQA
jgi:glycosyltransferase involved in cell wall biosynthesis